MPIKSCKLPDGGDGFQWGDHGTCYATRADAEKQAQAAYANGYAGDAMPLAADESNRRYDAEGRLHVEKNNITKATVNGYSGDEIMRGAQNGGSLKLEAGKVYQLLRDPEELKKATPTANNIQLLRKHVGVSAADPKKMDVAGSLGTDAKYEHPYITNSVVVWDAEYIAAVEEGKQRELSSSYRYTADMVPGTYEGNAYDGVMRDISFNHVALVEEGRAGPDVLVGDEKPGFLKGPTHMVAISKRVALDQVAKGFAAQLSGLAADAAPAVRKTWAKLAADARKAADEMDETEMAGDEPMELKAKDKMNDKAKDRAKDEKEPDEEDDEDEKKAKDRAKDRKAKDKAKDRAKAEDEKDDDGEEEEKEVEREAKAKDKAAKDRKAMDAAISKGVASGIAAERVRMDDIRDAERVVRPILGDVLAMDSAEDIYRLGCETQGVDLTDIPKGSPPGIYKTLLAVAQRSAQPGPRLAHDSAAGDVRSKFLAEFPGATIPRRA